MVHVIFGGGMKGVGFEVGVLSFAAGLTQCFDVSEEALLLS
jgi:hypothetical protein